MAKGLILEVGQPLLGGLHVSLHPSLKGVSPHADLAGKLTAALARYFLYQKDIFLKAILHAKLL